MTEHEKALMKFLAKYPERWHSFASDLETVTLVCALHNRGDCRVVGDQMISTRQGTTNARELF